MIINLKSETDLSGFYVVYEGSTNIEKKGWYGISHLMEHLLCDNLKHLEDRFDSEGILFNAETSDNEIIFYLIGLEEKIKKWRNKFIHLLSEFKTTKEKFEREKKVVLEEYKDAFNEQLLSHKLNLYRKLFNRYSPIGLKEDLINLKYEDCLEFFNLQYKYPSKIINVSKKTKYKNDDLLFKSPKINKNLTYIKNNTPPLELNNDFKYKTSVIILSPIIDDDFVYVHFINDMLGFGINSPLYKEIRNKRGLAYFVKCEQDRFFNKSVNSISTQISNKNYDELIETIENIIKNPKKYLTKKRFDIIKNYYYVEMKKSKILRHLKVDDWIYPKEWSIIKNLNKITFDKVINVYQKYFNFDDFYISNYKTEFK